MGPDYYSFISPHPLKDPGSKYIIRPEYLPVSPVTRARRLFFY